MKIKITDYNEPLEPGDIVELYFVATGLFWINAAQIAAIEHRLENDTRFEVRNHTIYEPNVIAFKVKVLKPNPEPVTITLIALAIIGAAALGIIFKLTLDSAYKIVNVPAEALQQPAIQAIAIGIILAVLGSIGLKFLRK